ncbi:MULTISPECIES: TrkH family potassium uptake protein [unclassified Sedimentibacter]|uniref:TrkH family potassium uptake protein n=1 Tax=unclassified Sedimentibacter TaxID=2649220 RepID=UPI0027DF4929|nr:TrkH family potassium uptake protein [Sedimentibacter sp. MB35-C1]WMJ76069.1 TrkH family potassium uptake protein [Sedimentibacter sp. MB35-C1]
MKKKIKHLSPSQTIMAGFALMILIGAFLLNLPIASKSGNSIGFINALFTATSANCVTGLVVVNTMEHWTLFGKVVILILIQFGALGFMSVMTVAMILMKQQISLRSRQAIQASFNQDNIGGMVKLVKKVVAVTFTIEVIGAVLLMIAFYKETQMKLSEAAFQGIFHSISAFCNAGFDNIGNDSFIPFQSSVPINFIVMTIIIAGGLGFTVWLEIIELLRNKEKRSLRLRIIHMSLHSKIVFSVTGILIIGGMLLFLLFEWSNPDTFGKLHALEKVQAALFQSVTLRTAGFNTVSQGALREISKFISCIFMLIGGSSASTAGGMKTVTIGIIIISMVSVLKGRNKIEVYGRTLPFDLLQKALTVATTMLIVVLVSTILLYFAESSNSFQHSFLDLLFEVCSATGTVGLTTGVTSNISTVGKGVLILCMYLGRLSPVTVVVALNVKLHEGANGINFPEERIIIG